MRRITSRRAAALSAVLVSALWAPSCGRSQDDDSADRLLQGFSGCESSMLTDVARWIESLPEIPQEPRDLTPEEWATLLDAAAALQQERPRILRQVFLAYDILLEAGCTPSVADPSLFQLARLRSRTTLLLRVMFDIEGSDPSSLIADSLVLPAGLLPVTPMPGRSDLADFPEALEDPIEWSASGPRLRYTGPYRMITNSFPTASQEWRELSRKVQYRDLQPYRDGRPVRELLDLVWSP